MPKLKERLAAVIAKATPHLKRIKPSKDQKKKLIRATPAVLLVAGEIAVVRGVALVSIPAGYIVAGVAIMFVAFLLQDAVGS